MTADMAGARNFVPPFNLTPIGSPKPRLPRLQASLLPEAPVRNESRLLVTESRSYNFHKVGSFHAT